MELGAWSIGQNKRRKAPRAEARGAFLEGENESNVNFPSGGQDTLQTAPETVKSQLVYHSIEIKSRASFFGKDGAKILQPEGKT